MLIQLTLRADRSRSHILKRAKPLCRAEWNGRLDPFWNMYSMFQVSSMFSCDVWRAAVAEVFQEVLVISLELTFSCSNFFNYIEIITATI